MMSMMMMVMMSMVMVMMMMDWRPIGNARFRLNMTWFPGTTCCAIECCPCFNDGDGCCCSCCWWWWRWWWGYFIGMRMGWFIASQLKPFEIAWNGWCMVVAMAASRTKSENFCKFILWMGQILGNPIDSSSMIDHLPKVDLIRVSRNRFWSPCPDHRWTSDSMLMDVQWKTSTTSTIHPS